MANTRELKNNTLGTIAAIRTLLERYPVLIDANYDENQTSFSFMFNILRIIGVSEEQIIEWIAKLFSGGGKAGGVLDAIEAIVKSILMGNIKALFTCSSNPILPDRLMDGVEQHHVGPPSSDQLTGIEIDLTEVDPYGILEKCPVGESSIFYFDTQYSDYNIDDMNAEGKTPNLHHQGYTTNELWKSRDFNAYLWFIINKGNNYGTARNKTYWDNRTSYLETFSRDESLKNAFFNAQENYSGSTDPSLIVVRDPDIVKKRYIRCDYLEKSSTSSRSNRLRVYLNPDMYYHKRRITVLGKDYYINKTAFEFAYDYIYSLKLFNPKTLVASVINAVVGIANSTSYNISINRQLIANRISKLVEKVIKADDNGLTTDDCYFSFSNKEYDKMLNDAVNKYNGTYQVGGKTVDVDYKSIVDKINKINSSANIVPGSKQEQDAIKDAFISAGEILQRSINTVELDEVGSTTFSIGFPIVDKFINEVVTQLVMQILSPKIAILLKIQTAIMGTEKKYDAWEDFLNNLSNPLIQIIKGIKDVILQQLMQWVMDELGVLLELFVSRLLLETTRNYRRLLLSARRCILNTKGLFGMQSYNAYDGITNDVDYADIYNNLVPEKTEPDKTVCY